MPFNGKGAMYERCSWYESYDTIEMTVLNIGSRRSLNVSKEHTEVNDKYHKSTQTNMLQTTGEKI